MKLTNFWMQVSIDYSVQFCEIKYIRVPVHWNICGLESLFTWWQWLRKSWICVPNNIAIETLPSKDWNPCRSRSLILSRLLTYLILRTLNLRALNLRALNLRALIHCRQSCCGSKNWCRSLCIAWRIQNSLRVSLIEILRALLTVILRTLVSKALWKLRSILIYSAECPESFLR